MTTNDLISDLATEAYKLKEMGNGTNIVSSSEYLLPKNDGMLFSSEPISNAASHNALSSSSLASSSISPPTSQSNNISQNNGKNIIHANDKPVASARGVHSEKYASRRDHHHPQDNSYSPDRKGTVLTRENVNDHNHMNSDFTTRHPSEGNKSMYAYNKERHTDAKQRNNIKDVAVTEQSDIDLDQTTMIGSALDLDSLSGDEDQNNRHIRNAQDYNTCDENNFVTTKASSLSEQCKTAGISTIYQDNRVRNSNINSAKQTIISGNNKTYYQAPNHQKSFDPSEV